MSSLALQQKVISSLNSKLTRVETENKALKTDSIVWTTDNRNCHDKIRTLEAKIAKQTIDHEQLTEELNILSDKSRKDCEQRASALKQIKALQQQLHIQQLENHNLNKKIQSWKTKLHESESARIEHTKESKTKRPRHDKTSTTTVHTNIIDTSSSLPARPFAFKVTNHLSSSSNTAGGGGGSGGHAWDGTTQHQSSSFSMPVRPYAAKPTLSSTSNSAPVRPFASKPTSTTAVRNVTHSSDDEPILSKLKRKYESASDDDEDKEDQYDSDANKEESNGSDGNRSEEEEEEEEEEPNHIVVRNVSNKRGRTVQAPTAAIVAPVKPRRGRPPKNAIKTTTQKNQQTASLDTSSVIKRGGGASGGSAKLSANAKSALSKQLRELVQCKDNKFQLMLLNAVIKRFGANQTLPIATFLEHGVPQHLAGLFKKKNNMSLVHKALITFNNIIARSFHPQLHSIMQKSWCVPQLLQLLTTDHDGIQEQSVWILDNVILDGDQMRVKALHAGALEVVLEALDKANLCKRASVIAAKLLCTFTMNNGLSHPQHSEQIQSLLTVVSKMLRTAMYAGQDILTHLIRTLCNVTECENLEVITLVCSYDSILTRLISLMSSTANDELMLLTVDTLSHLAAGSEDCTAKLLKGSVLTGLRSLMERTNSAIVATACRCISNICGGSARVIQAVQDANLFRTLIEFMSNGDTNSEVRFYAAYAVMFSVHGANGKQTQYLVEAGVIPLICGLLREQQQQQTSATSTTATATANSLSGKECHDMTVEALKCLDMLLNKFDHLSDFDYVSDIVTDCDGWGFLKQLTRTSKDKEIRKLAGELTVDKITAYYRQQEARAGMMMSGGSGV